MENKSNSDETQWHPLPNYVKIGCEDDDMHPALRRNIDDEDPEWADIYDGLYSGTDDTHKPTSEIRPPMFSKMDGYISKGPNHGIRRIVLKNAQNLKLSLSIVRYRQRSRSQLSTRTLTEMPSCMSLKDAFIPISSTQPEGISEILSKANMRP